MWALAFIGMEPGGERKLVYNGDRVDLAIDAMTAAGESGEGQVGIVLQSATGAGPLVRIQQRDFTYARDAAAKAAHAPAKRLKDPALNRA